MINFLYLVTFSWSWFSNQKFIALAYTLFIVLGHKYESENELGVFMHYHTDKLWQIVCFFSCLGQAGILWPEALIWKQKTEQQTWPTTATLGKEQQHL